MSTRSNWKNAAYPHVVKDANITAKNATIVDLESTDIRVSNIEGTGYLESKKNMVESTGDNYSSSEYAGLTISAEAISYTGGVQLPDLSVNGVTLEQYIQPMSFVNSFDGTEEIHGVVGYSSQRESDNSDSSANISAFGLFGAPGENVVLTVSEQEGGMYNYLNGGNQVDFATSKTGIFIDASNRVFIGVNGNELYSGGLDLLVKGSENAQLYVKGDVILDGSGVQIEKYIVDDMFIGSSVAIMGNQLSQDGMVNDISLTVPNLEEYIENYEASTGNQGYLFVANTAKFFADINVSGGLTIGGDIDLNGGSIKNVSEITSGDGNNLTFDISGGEGTIYTQGADIDLSGGNIKNVSEITSGDGNNLTFDISGGEGTIYTQGADIDLSGGNIKNVSEITSGDGNNLTFDISGGEGTIYTQGADINLDSGNIENAKRIILYNSDNSNSFIDFGPDKSNPNARIIHKQDTDELKISLLSSSGTLQNRIEIDGSNDTVTIKNANLHVNGKIIMEGEDENISFSMEDTSSNEQFQILYDPRKGNESVPAPIKFRVRDGSADDLAAVITLYSNQMLMNTTLNLNDKDLSGVGNITASSDVNFDVSGTINTQGADINLDSGNIENVSEITSGDGNNLSFDINGGDGTIYTQGAHINLGGGDIIGGDSITAKSLELGINDNSLAFIDLGTDDFKARIIYNQTQNRLKFLLKDADGSNAQPKIQTTYDIVKIMNAYLDLDGNDISNVAYLNDISATEISYLEGVTSNIQNQLDDKLDTDNSGVDITTGNLTIDEPDNDEAHLTMTASVDDNHFRIVYATDNSDGNDNVQFQLKNDDGPKTICKFNTTEVQVKKQLNLDGNDISGVNSISSYKLPDQSISKIFMAQTETAGIFRGDASANWNDDVATSYTNAELSTTGNYRLSGAKSGKTEIMTRTGSTGNNEFIDTENKYGNGRAIINYDVSGITPNDEGQHHFWRFGGAWIDYDEAYSTGKFYINESGYYRITANIRAINITSPVTDDPFDLHEMTFINHNVSFGFYVSRSSLSDDPAINPDYAAGLHKYWDEGITGSFGLIHLNGDSRGRCGSCTFSNIYYINNDAALSNSGKGESFCIRTLYSSQGTNTNDERDLLHKNNFLDGGATERLWSVARRCDDLQTWVQLIFEKIN